MAHSLMLWHKLLGYRRPVKWCELQPDRPVVRLAGFPLII